MPPHNLNSWPPVTLLRNLRSLWFRREKKEGDNSAVNFRANSCQTQCVWVCLSKWTATAAGLVSPSDQFGAPLSGRIQTEKVNSPSLLDWTELNWIELNWTVPESQVQAVQQQQQHLTMALSLQPVTDLIIKVPPQRGEKKERKAEWASERRGLERRSKRSLKKTEDWRMKSGREVNILTWIKD